MAGSVSLPFGTSDQRPVTNSTKMVASQRASAHNEHIRPTLVQLEEGCTPCRLGWASRVDRRSPLDRATIGRGHARGLEPRARDFVSGNSGGSHRYVHGRHDRGQWALQAVRFVSGGSGRLVFDPQGAGGRVPRAQRRGQDDDHAAADRLRRTDARLGADRRDRRPAGPDRRGRAPRVLARERATLHRHDAVGAAALLRRGQRHVAGRGSRTASRPWSHSAPSNRSPTSRSASYPKGIASEFRWPRRCCTTPRS